MDSDSTLVDILTLHLHEVRLTQMLSRPVPGEDIFHGSYFLILLYFFNTEGCEAHQGNKTQKEGFHC